jgi:DNA-binding response OmpR family regulator
MKILIVEDEQHLAEGLRFNLEAEGYEPQLASDGEAALVQLQNSDFDAVVLDVMLPGINGFEVARAMRDANDYTPILILTARGRPEDVLAGFEAGADDYLPKPFDLEIFLARLNGLLRRQKWSRRRDGGERSADVVSINGREIDFQNLELRGPNSSRAELTPLTLMEADLLRYLIDNAGNAVSRKSILEDVWHLSEDTDTRAIDNFIVRLRKLIEDTPNDPQTLVTVRGVGYKFVMPS